MRIEARYQHKSIATMFNLLVSGNGEWWEEPPFSSSVDRFKEYSGVGGEAADAARPETLRPLEEIPTLLMYEVGAGGPHARIVRHGRLRNIVRRGRDLSFDFELDAVQPYLDQRVVLSFAEPLGIEAFEQHRTHWAIKDANIPPALLATATAQRVERTVKVVAAEYVEALREGMRRDALRLSDELAQFPASVEKALLLLPARILQLSTPELFPIIGIEPRTPEGRRALNAVLARNAAGMDLPDDWAFSFAWFLDQYGSRTEAPQLEAAVGLCAARLTHLGAVEATGGDNVEDIACTLWWVSRSPLLSARLRREASMLMDRLVRRQNQEGFWEITENEQVTAGIRATAFATVALQRLGDDRYHQSIRTAVVWLLAQRLEETGALARAVGELVPDVIATTLAMEAIRRSDFAEDVLHVLEAGDAHLVSTQAANGGWTAGPWPEDFVTAFVLEYFVRRAEILPQVDGFLLMARDFFRKAEDLQLEGGANNRRLAAIATVHAVEMFLYGVFDRREDLALSAFKENGTETLGPREALRTLQEALQRTGVLIAPQRLPHRDNLSALIGRRDGIIHRAHEISTAELDEGIRQARRFITRFGRELLKLDLLQ
ncbi:hypothetical protein [Cupriavidus oxalaticus]|uniref:hypothetical protein n=1 Tax=Cupriavidus oxalaticus TaxID=96344 RepID=UPI004034C374